MDTAGETTLKKSASYGEVKIPDLEKTNSYFFTTTRNPEKRFIGIYNGKFAGTLMFEDVKTYEFKDGIEEKLDKVPPVKIISANDTTYKFFRLNFEDIPSDMNRYISGYIGGVNKRQSKRRNNKSKRRDNKSKRRRNRKSKKRR
jgi:hypothetical protein